MIMNNLSDYFESEQEYYLDSISYERIEKNFSQTEVQIFCKDVITANVFEGDKVRVTVTRELKFAPEILFKLLISYGVVLRIASEKKNDIDWEKIDLSSEFRDNGSFATGNLFNRISLLIGNITGSFGQSPLIVPPQFLKTEK